MSQLSPGLEAGLRRTAPLVFVAVEIETAAGPLRLLDGSSEVTFLGRTFRGVDPELGSLAAFDAISDGVGDEAPSLRLTLHPASNAAAGVLAAASMQGRRVLMWLGTINPVSGAVDGEPLLLFFGVVDLPTFRRGEGSRSVTLDCVSIWELLFDDWEGVRLTNAFHQTVWPGELGLEFVTDVTRSLPWGSDSPRPDVIRDATNQLANIR